jgi:hypothetical protein
LHLVNIPFCVVDAFISSAPDHFIIRVFRVQLEEISKGWVIETEGGKIEAEEM